MSARFGSIGTVRMKVHARSGSRRSASYCSEAHGSGAVRKRLVAGAAGLLSLRVAFGGLAFLQTIALARILGSRGLGAYSYALAWVTVLGAPAILGMDLLLVREIAGFRLRLEWALLRGMWRAANGIVLLTSAGLVAIVVSVSWLFRTRAAPDTLPALWVALPLVPLIALTRVRQATLQGLHRVVFGAIPERLILPALGLAFLYMAKFGGLPMTAMSAMALNVAATVIAFGVGAWMLHRNFPVDALAVVPIYRIAEWIRSALPILLLNSVGVVFAQADVLIVGAVKGAAAVGLYGVADKTADLLTFVLLAQSAAFSSTAATLYAQGDLVTLQRLTTRIARLTLLSAVPVAVVFIGFGGAFLTFFYGTDFAQARMALVFLSVGQLVNVAAGLNGMLLVMTNQTGQAVKVVGCSAAVNVVLNGLLVPRWGIEGGAVANMISLTVWNILATVALYRATGIHSSAVGTFGLRRS